MRLVAALRTLKLQFEECAVRFPSCVLRMIHAEPDYEYVTLSLPPDFAPIRDEVLSGQVTHRRDGRSPGSVTRRWWIEGDKAGSDAAESVLRQASRIIQRVDSATLERVGIEASSVQHECWCDPWVVALFELAWNPASLVTAMSFFWNARCPYGGDPKQYPLKVRKKHGVGLLMNLELLSAMWRDADRLPPWVPRGESDRAVHPFKSADAARKVHPWLPEMADGPPYFLSVIQDLYSSSAIAIDFLIDAIEADKLGEIGTPAQKRPKRRRGGQPPPPERLEQDRKIHEARVNGAAWGEIAGRFGITEKDARKAWDRHRHLPPHKRRK